jgi:hypothetical protein
MVQRRTGRGGLRPDENKYFQHNHGREDMDKDKKDLWQAGYTTKDCSNCKWENEAYEEEIGDGFAPCKRCCWWNGKD